MAFATGWTVDYCLSCDRQIEGGAYCSQACRLSDIAKSQEHVAERQYTPSESSFACYRPHRLQSDSISLSSGLSFVTSKSSISSYATASSGSLGFRKQPSQASSALLENYMSLFQKQPRITIDLSSNTSSFSSSRPVFSSEWLQHLDSRGILLDASQALDWSGRGQHVEYGPEDEPDIPLTTKGILGHGISGIVDKVACRRIDLARKIVRCTRRLTKEEAITEVEHLQRLPHRHVIRLVGTYLLRKDLAILTYPATEQNLEEYMELVHETLTCAAAAHLGDLSGRWARTLFGIIACLTGAVAFIHERNVKHMDIKPTNILIRQPAREDVAKVYIADFGIARAYKSANESFTDSPVPFTRTYTAPEVAQQDIRGLSAEIFSLGCVFMEILATTTSTPTRDERKCLEDSRSHDTDTSYQANLPEVLKWYMRVEPLIFYRLSKIDPLLPPQMNWHATHLSRLIPEMLDIHQSKRPSAARLKAYMSWLCCGHCDKGPEPFEAAEKSQ